MPHYRSADDRTPHDRLLLDALDAVAPVPFESEVWRVARTGRPALQGSTAAGRWTPEGALVLYTSLDADGALAEIGYRLSLEPVWPSRLEHTLHALTARTGHTLHLADLAALRPLGVDIARYAGLDYRATQAVAAAAHFLEFDGMLVPSARAPCANLVLFLDHLGPDALTIRQSRPVDWPAWRARTARAPTGR